MSRNTTAAIFLFFFLISAQCIPPVTPARTLTAFTASGDGPPIGHGPVHGMLARCASCLPPIRNSYGRGRNIP